MRPWSAVSRQSFTMSLESQLTLEGPGYEDLEI